VISTDLAAIVIVVIMTALVVIVVLGLHVWGAIQDGREEEEMKDLRHGDPGADSKRRR
jgi:hypothetical protein